VNPPGFGPTYSAWIERLPDAEQQITGCVGDKSCGVHPGDRMVVSIRQLRGSSWLITMVDRGHWSWRQTVTYASARSSAEWILEAPSEAALQTTLDGVGEVHFVGSNTFTAGGRTTVIGRGNPDRVTLLEGAEATPSALSRNGSAFNVCAYSFSCPAP
jgi:hypothetical protein